MKFVFCQDASEVAEKAFEVVKKRIQSKPDSVLGLATGSSPLALYDLMIQSYEKGELDFSQVTTVNLDEYAGIDPANTQSYHFFMEQNLFSKVNLKKENTFLPRANGKNKQKAIEEYNAVLDQVGIRDIQILGIGQNGHIAFNEPSDVLNCRTGLVDLTQNTIAANARFFESIEEVPTQAISMGMADIMHTRTVILIATGKKKSEAVKKLYDGIKIDTHFPASLLWLHPDTIVFADWEAAYLINK